jgi:anti-sigma B factor antagonist
VLGVTENEEADPVAGVVRLTEDGMGAELSGDLDLHTAPALLDLLPRLLDNCRQAGAERMEIRCADLVFCDSSGLAALIRAQQAASEARIRLVLTARPAHLDNLLDLAGLTPLFERGER